MHFASNLTYYSRTQIEIESFFEGSTVKPEWWSYDGNKRPRPHEVSPPRFFKASNGLIITSNSMLDTKPRLHNLGYEVAIFTLILRAAP